MEFLHNYFPETDWFISKNTLSISNKELINKQNISNY